MAESKGEKIDWVRGPKKADVSEVNVHKIDKAHKERGINVEADADNPGESQVTKTVVSGLPPKPQEDGNS